MQLGLAPVIDGRREQRREHEHVEQRAEQLRLRRDDFTRMHTSSKSGKGGEQTDDDHEHAIADREAAELHVRSDAARCREHRLRGEEREPAHVQAAWR